MTTAHRPTFDPARGGQGMRERDLSAQSKQYSSRDLPSHTRLKYRQDGQGTADEARATTTRDFKRDLDDRERRHRGAAASAEDKDQQQQPSSSSSSSSKRARLTDSAAASAGAGAAATTAAAAALPANLDADDQAVAAADLDSDADSAADDGEEEDETAELMAELAKIRRERAADAAKKEAERQAEDERIRTDNILKGNPLLNKAKAQQPGASQAAAPGSSGDSAVGEFKVKRRWNDDVVFKNCARDEDGGGRQRRPVGFINDTLRSEFHKKFMDKYIK